MRFLLFVWVAIGLACDPGLGSSRDGGGPAPRASLDLAIEPSAPVDDAPPILRLHFDLPKNADLSLVAVVRGDVGATRLRELASGDISASLRDRMIDAPVWRAADGRVVAAPMAILDAGEPYSLASGD